VSEIKLSGGEITILKTLGLTGAQMAGTQLVDRIAEMESAEFLDTLTGLIEQDYIVASRVNIRTMDSVKAAAFRVNAAISRELREAVYPSRQAKPDTGDAGGGPDYRVSEDSPIRSWLKLWPWLAAVLTGVLTTLCFAPFEQTWFCWLSSRRCSRRSGSRARDETSLAARSAPWIRRGRSFLLGRLLVAPYRDGPGPDSGRTLHGRLFCDLELARWPSASPQLVARAGGAPERLAGSST
jgi:hypothetical protein